MEVYLDITPLSVNQAWQGKRFKTDKYKGYETEVLCRIKPMKLPEPPYRAYFEFGLSNVLSDWDNPVKPLQDIMQKKYGFNDKDILEAHVKKVKVAKGSEYFIFRLEPI